MLILKYQFLKDRSFSGLLLMFNFVKQTHYPAAYNLNHWKSSTKHQPQWPAICSGFVEQNVSLLG